MTPRFPSPATPSSATTFAIRPLRANAGVVGSRFSPSRVLVKTHWRSVMRWRARARRASRARARVLRVNVRRGEQVYGEGTLHYRCRPPAPRQMSRLPRQPCPLIPSLPQWRRRSAVAIVPRAARDARRGSLRVAAPRGGGGRVGVGSRGSCGSRGKWSLRPCAPWRCGDGAGR
jgi:hypothetical protein